jgi:hypothetical protein
MMIGVHIGIVGQEAMRQFDIAVAAFNDQRAHVMRHNGTLARIGCSCHVCVNWKRGATSPQKEESK